MSLQRFGVLPPNAGLIGHFDVPPIAPMSFFDVFFGDVPARRSAAQPGAADSRQPAAGRLAVLHGGSLARERRRHLSGTGGSGTVNRHFGEMPLCPGAGPTNLFVETGCTPVPWARRGASRGCAPASRPRCSTPTSRRAPNPVPAGWVGLISPRLRRGGGSAGDDVLLHRQLRLRRRPRRDRGVRAGLRLRPAAAAPDGHGLDARRHRRALPHAGGRTRIPPSSRIRSAGT